MPRGRPLEVELELLEAFKRSGAVTAYLVTRLPAAIWRAAPPAGRGRTIAAIVAHMQGVRRTFARMGGAQPGPPSLDKRSVTPTQAQQAFLQSTDDLARLFEAAIASGRARVKGMPRRVIDMLTYLMQHDGAPPRPDLHAGERPRPLLQLRRQDAIVGLESDAAERSGLNQELPGLDSAAPARRTVREPFGAAPLWRAPARTPR